MTCPVCHKDKYSGDFPIDWRAKLRATWPYRYFEILALAWLVLWIGIAIYAFREMIP